MIDNEKYGLPNKYTALATAVLENIEPLVGTDAMQSGQAVAVAEQTIFEVKHSQNVRRPDQLWRRKRALRET